LQAGADRLYDDGVSITLSHRDGVMSPHKAARDSDLHTVEDFYALVPDGQKADLLDGVIYMASPDSSRADDLTNLLNFLMSGFADARRLGCVKGSRYAFMLTEHRAPEPDVAFIAAERLEIVTERGGTAAPDIAVEVVSRDSRSRDYVEKKNLYEQSGVREYWIIDSLQDRAEFYRLEEGHYRLVPFSSNRFFLSEALPGFWLDVEWLVRRELPDRLECLQRILAGPPDEL
jgi:Uma2 family endonuclease